MEKTNLTKLRRSVSELSAIMYKIYVDWFVSERPKAESEHIACDMYRMMIIKAKSIWLMSKGIVIVRTQKDIIPAPSTMYPILRSMYEMLFLFRCMFVYSKNDKERELLLNLWEIKGNNNLTQVPNEMLLDDESISKKDTASEENELLKNKIAKQMRDLTLAQSIKTNIKELISCEFPILKGFTFKHCEQNDTITDFCMKNFSDKDMGGELSCNRYIYSHYSAHSHPSYLGVKHFEEMYEKTSM